MKGLGSMLLLEFDRGQVLQRHVRPFGVVVAAPSLDDDLRFPAAAEPLEVQALVPEAPVERLVGAVLPGLAGINVRGFHAAVGQPFQHRGAHELGAIVTAE